MFTSMFSDIFQMASSEQSFIKALARTTTAPECSGGARLEPQQLVRLTSTSSSDSASFMEKILRTMDFTFLDVEDGPASVLETDNSSVASLASASTLDDNNRNIWGISKNPNSLQVPPQPQSQMRTKSLVFNPAKYSKKAVADFIEFFMKLIKKHGDAIIDGLAEQDRKKNTSESGVSKVKFLMNSYLDEEALSAFDDKFFDSSSETMSFWAKHSKENDFKCVGGPMSCVNWWLQLKVKAENEKTCILARPAELRKIKLSSFVKYDEKDPTQYKVFLNAQYI